MNIQEKIEAWVKALRSGEYKQIGGKLKRDDWMDIKSGHCCLGVLEEVLEGKVESYEEEGISYLGYPTDDFLLRQGLIEEDIDSDKSNEVRGYLRTLAEKNDKGESFEDIANYIERTAHEVIK